MHYKRLLGRLGAIDLGNAMVMIVLGFTTFFVVGCGTPSRIVVPSQSELRTILSGQRCITTEAGFEDSTRWVTRKSEIRCEIGRWLPDGSTSLLVTVEVLDACHAEGLVHHLIAVLHPESHKRLTPVFHLIADQAKRRILNGAKQDVLLYDAQKDRSFTDVSYLLRFRHGAVDAVHAIGQRDPERFDFSISPKGNRFEIREFEWRGDGKKRHRFVTKSIPVIWNPDILSLAPASAGPADDKATFKGTRFDYTTKTYRLVVRHPCPEGCVSCDNVSLICIGKRAGHRVVAKGSTWHTIGADGVTPGRFLGYVFTRGRMTYRIYGAEMFEITDATGKVVLKERCHLED